MTTASTSSLAPLLERSRTAARALARLSGGARADALLAVADALPAAADEILRANAADVATERARGTPAALVDRLELTRGRLDAMAAAVRRVAALPDPVGRTLRGWQLANGLEVRQVSAPFGVIGMIYESRPNVTVDAAVLAFRAGSAALLRGSSNALASNRALATAMRDALARAGAPVDAVQLIDSPDRELVTELLTARGHVDLVIPRGGASLIAHVVENATVPVIETGVGNCHVFVDDAADLDQALAIVRNAKVQRPGVCNAAETLLVHAGVAATFLPAALADLAAAGVTLHGCDRTRAHAPADVTVLAAGEDAWTTEFLDLALAVRVVDDLDAALDHIRRFGTQHSEAIVTRSRAAARRFQAEVDAAAVYVNASTRFTDGEEFGFGAEIGISTQKLHARGPMGLAELVTSKYLIDGEGQIRG